MFPTLYTIETGFNRAEIMRAAWKQFRVCAALPGREITFAEALRRAWSTAKRDRTQAQFSEWKAANAEKADRIEASVRRIGTLQQPMRVPVYQPALAS